MNFAKKPAAYRDLSEGISPKPLQRNQGSEGYSPKEMPLILSKAKEASLNMPVSEVLVEEVTPFCTIVDRSEMKIVGVKVELNPYSDYDAISIVQKYIKDGTCKLLEDLLETKTMTKGEYIAAVIEAKSGIDYTYIIGVEVNSFDNLPAYLPPGTTIFTCPPARYGKVVRNASDPGEKHPQAKQAICYLSSSEFRGSTGYAYDMESVSFRVFDEASEMIFAYEPVKKPASDEEKFAQVSYEVVMLPEIKVIGCFGEGIDCMWNLFNIENDIDWKAAGCLNEKQYISFGCKDDQGQDTTIFGRPVASFENVPGALSARVMPSGLWLKLYQKQINNDDTSIFFEGSKEVVFFNKHPEFEEDYSERGFVYVAQYEQGGYILFPVRLKK
ncbi:hypothetical protein ACFQ3W_01045 [Paenibacillus puldeungensis]|uniref:Uncharacterized protein n=1 Tax=Paenibacillus puldeungensis TaxID=696536 RepID=A0ABW3RR18_9BACL